MQFAVLGISYKEAGLDIRDKVSFSDSAKMDFLQKAGEAGITQCMLLSTCNRSEIYYFYESKEQNDRIKNLYQKTFPDVDLSSLLIIKEGENALHYLFQVAAGLDSLVVGEDQILGQVREAYEFSHTMGFAGKMLNKVVRDAITCSKEIKTQLKISEHPVSVGYAGIRELDQLCGIAGKDVLVIGSGKTATLALKYVVEYQAAHVYVCNHIFSHASELQNEFSGVEVIHYEERYDIMKNCDIVISATSSPHPVVRKAHYYSSKPIVFLDLASPRDIDPELASIENVRLINLDTLLKVVEENKKLREGLVSESRERIDMAVADTLDWIQKSHMDSTIESLQQRCQNIEEESFAYLNRKIELSKREQKIVKKVFHASLQRLLREPIQELKQLDTDEMQEEYKKMMCRLFQI